MASEPNGAEPQPHHAMSTTQSEIGLIGLAVMGQNLALNIADHGFRISVFNRTTSKTEAFVAENPDTPFFRSKRRAVDR